MDDHPEWIGESTPHNKYIQRRSRMGILFSHRSRARMVCWKLNTTRALFWPLRNVCVCLCVVLRCAEVSARRCGGGGKHDHIERSTARLGGQVIYLLWQRLITSLHSSFRGCSRVSVRSVPRSARTTFTHARARRPCVCVLYTVQIESQSEYNTQSQHSSAAAAANNNPLECVCVVKATRNVLNNSCTGSVDIKHLKNNTAVIVGCSVANTRLLLVLCTERLCKWIFG